MKATGADRLAESIEANLDGLLETPQNAELRVQLRSVKRTRNSTLPTENPPFNRGRSKVARTAAAENSPVTQQIVLEDFPRNSSSASMSPAIDISSYSLNKLQIDQVTLMIVAALGSIKVPHETLFRICSQRRCWNSAGHIDNISFAAWAYNFVPPQFLYNSQAFSQGIQSCLEDGSLREEMLHDKSPAYSIANSHQDTAKTIKGFQAFRLAILIHIFPRDDTLDLQYVSYLLL